MGHGVLACWSVCDAVAKAVTVAGCWSRDALTHSSSFKAEGTRPGAVCRRNPIDGIVVFQSRGSFDWQPCACHLGIRCAETSCLEHRCHLHDGVSATGIVIAFSTSLCFVLPRQEMLADLCQDVCLMQRLENLELEPACMAARKNVCASNPSKIL